MASYLSVAYWITSGLVEMCVLRVSVSPQLEWHNQIFWIFYLVIRNDIAELTIHTIEHLKWLNVCDVIV